MGGSKEDRNEPAIDHWSLAVQDGKGLELEWRMELPIPRGGPHRYSFLFISTQFLCLVNLCTTFAADEVNRGRL